MKVLMYSDSFTKNSGNLRFMEGVCVFFACFGEIIYLGFDAGELSTRIKMYISILPKEGGPKNRGSMDLFCNLYIHV